MNFVSLAADFTILCIALSIVICLVRVLRGPSPQDRVWGLDAMYINCMLLTVVLGILFRTSWYFDIALLMAIFSYVGTTAMAKFLLRGEVIEP